MKYKWANRKPNPRKKYTCDRCYKEKGGKYFWQIAATGRQSNICTDCSKREYMPSPEEIAARAREIKFRNARSMGVTVYDPEDLS